MSNPRTLGASAASGAERSSLKRGLSVIAGGSLVMALSLSAAVCLADGVAAAKSAGSKKSAAPAVAATAAVNPSVVTWGLAGHDTITITASGLTPGATYYEQVQSEEPTGAAITFVESFVATSTGGVPSPNNTWEMNDPYNASQPPPPTWSGPAEVVITSSATTRGWSLSATPVATAPFTILPGQNTLVS